MSIRICFKYHVHILHEFLYYNSRNKTNKCTTVKITFFTHKL